MKDLGELVTITHFPMPPSANNLQKSTRGGRRYNTEAYQHYIDEYQYWALSNLKLIRAIKEKMQAMKPHHVLYIETMYFFERHKILTKSGRPKRNDTSNREKALHDGIAKVFEFDDCLFWCGMYGKQALPETDKKERVQIQIRVVEI